MTGDADFWSRRKAAAAAERAAEARLAEEAEAEAARQALEEKPDEEVLAELDLPDPDAMGQGDDFSAFMAQAVPERLRRRALRKLWISNPVLANLDSLVDYGEDFTDAATVVENLQTAYRVGKGMLRRIEEEDGEAEAEAGDGERAVAAAPEPVAAETGGDGAAPDDAGPEALPAPAAGDADGDTADDGDGAPEMPARRHMRFAFADAEDGPAPGGSR